MFTLFGLAYMFAIVPAWLAAGTDWALSAKPFYSVATMAVAAATAHLVARYFGNPMNHQEFILVALAGEIPATVCSWLSRGSKESVDA